MAEASDVWGLLYQNLMDAGCDRETAQQCLCLARGNRTADLQRLLSRHRAALLDRVHENQNRIDFLYYLLYEISKNHIF